MRKMMIFLICLLAALAVDFLREGITSRVYAQFVIIDPAATRDAAQASAAKGAYPAPGARDKLKGPYPVNEPVRGSYPAPAPRPAEKKVK